MFSPTPPLHSPTASSYLLKPGSSRSCYFPCSESPPWGCHSIFKPPTPTTHHPGPVPHRPSPICFGDLHPASVLLPLPLLHLFLTSTEATLAHTFQQLFLLPLNKISSSYLPSEALHDLMRLSTYDVPDGVTPPVPLHADLNTPTSGPLHIQCPLLGRLCLQISVTCSLSSFQYLLKSSWAIHLRWQYLPWPHSRISSCPDLFLFSTYH